MTTDARETVTIPDDVSALTEVEHVSFMDPAVASMVTTEMEADAHDLALQVATPVRQELVRMAKAGDVAEPEFGTTTPLGYKYLDCMTYGPVNMTIPPYRPRRIVALGRPVLLVGVLWINPANPLGGALPGTKTLGGDRYRARIEVIKKGGGLAKQRDWTGEFNSPAPIVSTYRYWTVFNEEGRYEFCFSFDDREPQVPLAAFSNWHYEPDPDIGFFGRPTIPPGWQRRRGEFGVIPV